MAKTITPGQVCAITTIYSIARSVVDELMPATGELSDRYDQAVFDSSMKILKDKEAQNGKLS